MVPVSGYQCWAQAASTPAARVSLSLHGASSARLPQVQKLGLGGWGREIKKTGMWGEKCGVKGEVAS